MAKNLEGKVFLVTGGTEGIGKAAAVEFAKRGATLALVARSREKGERVVSELKAASGHETIELLIGDLSTIAACRSVAKSFREKYDRLDVLVNNAGAYFDEYTTSADGLEMTFALNHIAYFVLTNEVLDLLKKTPGSRIVSTSSAAHQAGKIDLATVAKRNGKAGWGAYGDSKLANILFTRELSRRLGADGPKVNCFHPGFVQTGFGQNTRGFVKTLISVGAAIFARKPAKGAETLIWLATSPEGGQFTGEYFFDKQVAGTTWQAKDAALAKGLWDLSEKLVASA